MDTIETLRAEFSEARRLIDCVDADQLGLPTPCADFDVRALLDHMTTWIAVFDGAVNDRPLDFDPESHHLGSGWAEAFAKSADGVLAGLAEKGHDRPMTMTTDPIPGSMVVDMLSMEYIGHGLDLAKATGQEHRFTQDQAVAALEASGRLIQPEYRGTGPGQFHPVVETGPDATAIERFVAFLGREP